MPRFVPHTHSFTYAAGTGEQANTITATCTGGCPAGYDTKGITLTLTAPTSPTYDGNAKEAMVIGYPDTAPANLAAVPTPVYYATDSAGSTSPSGSELSGAPTDAGDYVAQMTWGEQTAKVAFSIAKAILTDVSVTQNGTLTYNGQAQTPQVTPAATAQGNQTVTFTYSATLDGTYGATVPAVTDATASGTPYTFYFKASAPNHEDAADSFTVTVEKANQTTPAAPTAESKTVNSITLTAVNGCEYRIGENGDWTDDPAFTSLTMNTEYTFYQRLKGDANHNPSPASLANIKTNDHAHEWSYAVGTGENANTITATCANTDGGHSGDTTATLTIKAPAKTTFGDAYSADATITGNIDGVATPGIVYKQGETALGAAPTGAGTYTASITLTDVPLTTGGKGDVTASVQYIINKASIRPAVNITDWTYGETANAPSLTDGSNPGNGTVAYTYAVQGSETYDAAVPTEAGNYTVKATIPATDNYLGGTCTTSLTISRKPVTVSGIAASKAYDGTTAATLQTTSATITGLLDADANAVTVASATGSYISADYSANAIDLTINATNVTLGGEKAANYTVTSASGTGTISKRPVTITANDQTVQLGGTVSTTSDDVTVANDTPLVTGHVIASVTLSGNTNAVTDNGVLTFSTVVIRDGSMADVTVNYDPNPVNGKLTVTKINPTYTAPTVNTLTYDGKDQTLVTAGSTQHGTISYALLNGADATPDDNTAWNETPPTGRNAGTYYVWWRLTGDDNHNSVDPAKLEPTISRKALAVTANDQTITYGDAISQTKYTADNPVNGEALTVTLTATIGTGTSGTITPTAVVKAGDTDTTANYALTLNNGTLTVNNKALTVTPDSNRSKVYGETDPTLTYTATGFAYNEDINSITGSLKRKPGDKAGTYEILNDDLSAPHYDITVTSGVLFTILQKPITGATVTLKLPANPVYDGSQKTVTVASVTLTDGTALDVADYEESGELSGTAAGTYTVTVTGKDNYKGTATQTWTISMYQPTIQTKPTAKAITYGHALSDSALTGGVVKFQDSDVEGTFTWETPATKPVVADSDKTAYKVVFTPKDTINFSTAECEVTLTVNPADAVAATVKADNRTYDASEKALVSVDDSTLVGGDMWYALGKDATTAPTDGWRKDVPKATNAGTYYVWYKVVGDENHNDTDPAPLTVTISPVDKTALNEAIASAEAYYDTIKDKAEYAGVAAALNSAIEAAKAVAANDNVTQSAVAQAIKDVNGATDKAKADVAAIDKQAADEAAAQAVTDAINALPNPAGVNDKAAVEAARKAYEALTEDQKKLVPEDVVKKLTTAEEQVKAAEADVAAAQAVTDAINALSNPAGVNDKAAVEAARKAFDALTADQKALVPADVLNKLTTAEAQVKAAEEAAKKQAADEAAAKAVVDAINALPNPAGTGDKPAVEAARKSYEALTEDQKKLVPADVLNKLTTAEAQVKAAEEAARKQAADEVVAKTVVDAINALPNPAGTGDKPAVEAARKSYEALTEDQKKLVPADVLNKLTTAEEQVKAAEADKAAAQAVTDAINALPNPADVNDKPAVEAARKAYDDLTETQKKLVPEDVLNKLTVAEEQVRVAEEPTKAINIAKCRITVKNYTYTGEPVKKLAVKVMYKGKKLKEGRDYTLAWNKKAKRIGTYRLVVKGIGNFYGMKKMTFKIIPQSTVYTELTPDKHRITLAWERRDHVTRYQIQYSLNKDFSDGKKFIIWNKDTLTRDLKYLKPETTYYVRIRTIAKVKGKNYYSVWSKPKTVTTLGEADNAVTRVVEGESLDLGEGVTLPGIDGMIDVGIIDGIGMDEEIELTLE